MIIKRSKLFAGYSETPISGTSYHSGQLSNSVLDLIENSANKVEKIPVIKDNQVVKRKVDRIKDIVRPLKKLLNKNNKRANKDNN